MCRISFYDLTQTNYNVPVSRIENLVGIPLCIEYYRWPASYRPIPITDPKNKDEKRDTLESLLIGDDLGICHLYNIDDPEWHYCEYKRGSKDKNKCHKALIKAKFEKTLNDQCDTQKRIADYKQTKKVISFGKFTQGIEIVEKQIHKGWITKIKYYPDLNYVVSSSLDGFIHIHKIDLTYEENRTFNLH